MFKREAIIIPFTGDLQKILEQLRRDHFENIVLNNSSRFV